MHTYSNTNEELLQFIAQAFLTKEGYFKKNREELINEVDYIINNNNNVLGYCRSTTPKTYTLVKNEV